MGTQVYTIEELRNMISEEDFEKIFYPKKKKGFWNIKSIELKINWKDR